MARVEILTYNVLKQAEAQTGAGMATVCRVVAERVTPAALNQRVIQNTGEKTRKVSNEKDRLKPIEEVKPQPQHSDAAYFVALTIGNLERIMDVDPGIVDGFTDDRILC